MNWVTSDGDVSSDSTPQCRGREGPSRALPPLTFVARSERVGHDSGLLAPIPSHTHTPPTCTRAQSSPSHRAPTASRARRRRVGHCGGRHATTSVARGSMGRRASSSEQRPPHSPYKTRFGVPWPPFFGRLGDPKFKAIVILWPLGETLSSLCYRRPLSSLAPTCPFLQGFYRKSPCSRRPTVHLSNEVWVIRPFYRTTGLFYGVTASRNLRRLAHLSGLTK